MERRVAQAQHAALTDPEQVDGIDLVPSADRPDVLVDVVVDVVVDRGEPVGPGRVSPIRGVDVEPGAEEPAHKGPVLLQVDDGVTPDERIEDEDRDTDGGTGRRRIMIERRLVDSQHLLLRRRRDLDVRVANAAESTDGADELVLSFDEFVEGLSGIKPDGEHHCHLLSRGHQPVVAWGRAAAAPARRRGTRLRHLPSRSRVRAGAP